MSESVGTAEAQTSYPGLRRLPYVLYGIGLTVALVVIGILDSSAYPFPLFVLVAYLLGCLYLLYQRFRNQGVSGWWSLGIFIPLVNVYISLRAAAYPEGYAAHKRFDMAAKVIIGLTLALIALLLITFIF